MKDRNGIESSYKGSILVIYHQCGSMNKNIILHYYQYRGVLRQLTVIDLSLLYA